MNTVKKLNFTDKRWLLGGIVNIIAHSDVVPYKYTFGTINGIYAKTECGGIDIIVINNDEPHNGDFELFIDALEKYAQESKKRVAICAFFNERLYWHIRKRKGWGNITSTMDRLEYYGQETDSNA